MMKQMNSNKKIVSFFKTLNIDFVSDGIVKKLIEYGFDSIKKILLINKTDLLGIDGVQTKLADKLYLSIHKVIDNPIDISKLMVASLCFGRGFGIKKIDKITTKFNNILEDNLTDMIETVDGFSTKLAQQFISNLTGFKEFYSDLPFLKISFKKKSNNILSGQKIVMTGFRDKKIEFIEQNGGSIMSSLSKNTTLLITKDNNSNSSKTQAALLLGINITTQNEFCKKYNII